MLDLLQRFDSFIVNYAKWLNSLHITSRLFVNNRVMAKTDTSHNWKLGIMTADQLSLNASSLL